MLLGLGLLRTHRTENRGGMVKPDLGGWVQASEGEDAMKGPNRTGQGLGTKDKANASNTEEHLD